MTATPARIAATAAGLVAVYVAARVYMRSGAPQYATEAPDVEPWSDVADFGDYPAPVRSALDFAPQWDEPEPLPGAQDLGALTTTENLAADWLRSTWDTMTTATDADTAATNRAAFLMMIRHAEGTASADGYRALFGHTPRRPKLFSDFSDHPRIAAQFTDKAGRTLYTTAAGAYQFLAVSPLPSGNMTRVDTWDRLKRKLKLPDFSPASQDAAALELIREAGALADVEAGRLDAAIGKVRRIWASMPGAGYAQPEKSRDTLAAVYLDNGGSIA